MFVIIVSVGILQRRNHMKIEEEVNIHEVK